MFKINTHEKLEFYKIYLQLIQKILSTLSLNDLDEKKQNYTSRMNENAAFVYDK